jgi:hypothetical protein
MPTLQPPPKKKLGLHIYKRLQEKYFASQLCNEAMMCLCKSAQKKRLINEINDNLEFSASLSVYTDRYTMLVAHAIGGGAERTRRKGG